MADFSFGILDALDSGAVILNGDQCIRHWNDWMARSSGLTARAAIGRALWQALPDGRSSRLHDAIEQALATGLPSKITSAVNGFILPLRREHVAGYYTRSPVWLVENLGLERVREEAADMERSAHKFYVDAAKRTTDADTRKLLGDLAIAEAGHERAVERSIERHLDGAARGEEDAAAHRQFLLTWVQPGLAGLMDGSVSTLAPIFATAFATGNTWTTFLVGLSASIGAGISMGFTEAVHDDGKLSGRGAPWKRGLASGVMTALGGLGHALPYLIPSFWTATAIALVIVFVELWAIVWIQNKYMETPFLRATFQVVLGGALVLAAGILIGGS